MTAKTSPTAWRLGFNSTTGGVRGSRAQGRYGTDLGGWSLVGPRTPRVAAWSEPLLVRCRELRPGWYLNRVVVRYAEGRARVRLDGRVRSEAPETRGSGLLAGEVRVSRLRARLGGRPVDLEVVDLTPALAGEAGWKLDLARAVALASRWPSAGRLASVRAAARVEAGDRLVLRHLTKLLSEAAEHFKGYRIEVRGRLRGSDRSEYWLAEGGVLGRSSVRTAVSSGQAEAVGKFGTLGVRVLVNLGA